MSRKDPRNLKLEKGWVQHTLDNSICSLYLQYGLHSYPNYLSEKMAKLEREYVVKAAKNPYVKARMVKWIDGMRERALELEGIIAEAENG